MRTLLVFAFLLMAGPAVALSCMRPDVARSFQTADELGETYVVVKGELIFDERLIPERDLTGQNARETEIPARLKGMVLSKSGFKAEFKRDITLVLQCFGPWCASAKSGVDYLAFLEVQDNTHVMRVDPCGSLVFQEPTANQIKKAKRCMAGQTCKPDGL